jgi:hypothetical protein
MKKKKRKKMKEEEEMEEEEGKEEWEGKRNGKRKNSHIAKAPKSIIDPTLAEFCLS